MAHARSFTVLFAIANALIPLSCFIFGKGFFPYKPFMSGLATFDAVDHEDLSAAPFNKVVFMVVDALRSDFVYSDVSGFEFTQKLINTGRAVPFTAYATSPTVTMPRLKAMTTGSVPSFLDFILNFAESDTSSSLATQDTWLTQMKTRDTGKLVMYGDDTWLKLFPGTFDRSEGTTSFFVSDFTEVDNNVTRHVPRELDQDDWSVMILHYLGMDHIGHKAGPRSPNMLPKQKEMDAIVEQVYNAMETRECLNSTLFILCGDHGMTDRGNHGGSAPGETSPALIFISPKLHPIAQKQQAPIDPLRDYEYYTMVDQSDIAPTLAGLLGIPMPLNSLGVFIPKFLDLWPIAHDRLYLIRRNALQLLNIVKATFPNLAFEDPTVPISCEEPQSTERSLLCSWRHAIEIPNGADSITTQEETVARLLSFCRHAQRELSSTASNFDMSKLFLGIGLAAISTVLLSIIIYQAFVQHQALSTFWLFLVTTAFALMMFGSSFVEEEQDFWRFMLNGWLCLTLILSFNKGTVQERRAILLILAQRAAQELSSPESSLLLAMFSLLVCATYATVAYQAYLKSYRSTGLTENASLFASAIIAGTSLLFKISFTYHDEPRLLGSQATVETLLSWLGRLNLVTLARLAFYWTALSILFVLVSGRIFRASASSPVLTLEKLFPLFTFVLLTQTRVDKIPLFLLFEIQRQQLSGTRQSIQLTALLSLLLSHNSFFLLGGSNNISTIDLSNAYNGVADYAAAMVGILLFLSNWAGPIYWSLSSLLLLLQSANQADFSTTQGKVNGLARQAPRISERRKVLGLSSWFRYTSILALFISAGLSATMCACVALRTHLFVWTVFSPKYLYAMAWAIGWHLGVNVFLGVVFTWCN